MRGSQARDRKGKEGESAEELCVSGGSQERCRRQAHNMNLEEEELYVEEAKNDVARTRNTDKHISLPCVLVNLESRRRRTQNNVFVRGVL